MSQTRVLGHVAGWAIAALIALGASLPQPALALKLGDPAPPFTLKTLDGKPYDSAKLRDKRAQMLIFWASW